MLSSSLVSRVFVGGVALAVVFGHFASAAGARTIDLPGGRPVAMDYLAYDSANSRVWVPAGNTGNVDVIDVATGKLTTLGGFPTIPSQRRDRPNMGPSSAAIAGGTVWVGNRGDSSVCAFDARTLGRGGCVKLPSMPDGLAYVAATGELWVTTPRDHTITIIDVKSPTPRRTATIATAGSPEGFAVDDARGLFYTNLEDKDRTLAIDVKSRAITTDWPATCGTEGPRGLAIDGARRLLFVACTDGAVTLDLARHGTPLGRIKTGGGVDNLAYASTGQRLYVASGKDATLTIAHVTAGGALTPVAVLPTAKGARNPVVDGAGTAYVADSAAGQIIVVSAGAAAPGKTTAP